MIHSISSLIPASIVALCLFVCPTIVLGQNVAVDPQGWSFSEVDLGESSTKAIRIDSLGPTPLYINSASVLGDADGAFSVNHDPFPPELFEGESVYVDLTFQPPAAGLFEATLEIITNDRETPVLRYDISGTGVIPEPATLGIISMLATVICRPRGQR
jgi:hypothetical protein